MLIGDTCHVPVQYVDKNARTFAVARDMTIAGAPVSMLPGQPWHFIRDGATIEFWLLLPAERPVDRSANGWKGGHVQGTPSDRGQASESAAHALPDGPAGARPDGAAQDKPDRTAPLSRKRERSWQRKMLIPLVLAVAGMAMLLAGWLLYPSGAGTLPPGIRN